MAELENFHTFLGLFLLLLLCLSFAYRFVLRLPPGLPRLSFLLPLFPILFLLPWSTSSYHFRAIFSFIFLWTLPSKLLLLCFDSPFDFYPLSPSSSGLSYFLTSVLLPTRIVGPIPKKSAGSSDRASGSHSLLLKTVVLVCIMNLCYYRDRFHHWMINLLYELLVFLGLEVILGSMANLAAVSLRVQVDPPSNDPFLSTSLSDFWGRRWNLVVTSILRSTVYLPTQQLLMSTEKQITRVEVPISGDSSYPMDRVEPKNVTKNVTSDTNTKPSPICRAIATLAAFLVSGLFHELIFFVLSKTPVLGFSTAFFVLHGLATAVEAFIRNHFPSLLRLPRTISILLTLAFVHFTSVWLFFPPITKSGADIRTIAEFFEFQSALLSMFKT